MLSSFFSDIKTGIYNLWFFRKVIWNFRWWDYTHNLEVFSKSLQYTADKTEKFGNHERSSEIVSEINEVMELMKKVRSEAFIEHAEKIVGYEVDTDWTFEKIPGSKAFKMIRGEKHDKSKESEVFDLSHKLEKENWEMIWKKLNDEMQNWWD